MDLQNNSNEAEKHMQLAYNQDNKIQRNKTGKRTEQLNKQNPTPTYLGLIKGFFRFVCCLSIEDRRYFNDQRVFDFQFGCKLNISNQQVEFRLLLLFKRCPKIRYRSRQIDNKRNQTESKKGLNRGISKFCSGLSLHQSYLLIKFYDITSMEEFQFNN